MSIDRRFRAQHGLASIEDARASGLTDRQIQHRVDSGEWIRLRRGVYRHTAARITYESRLRAETLRRKSVVSHRPATVCWGLDVFCEPLPEITVPVGTRVGGSVIVHRSSQWQLRDQTTRRGIPCTGIGRTILDCAAVCPADTVERLAEAAILRNLTTWSDLELVRHAHSRPGRNGCGPLHQLLIDRRGTPTVSRSDFSLLVANLLTDAGLPVPQREFVVRDPSGGHILALDLAWPDVAKAVELDGLSFHFSPRDLERDKWKRNRVKAQGWAVLEITWSMYRDHPERVIDLVARFLAT